MLDFIKGKDALYGLRFLSVLVFIFFLPVIIGAQTLFSAVPNLALEEGPYGFSALKTPWTLDAGAYMWTDVTQTIFWYKSLLSGEFPFWNPYQGLGQPLSGNILSAAYNPIKMIFFVLFPHLKTFDFFMIFKVLAAGFGTFLFIKNIGFSRRASLLGGIAYMFSGYFIQWLTHWSLAADMMIPYIFLSINHFFAKNGNFSSSLILSTSLSIMVLSGVPEGVIAISIFTVMFSLFKFFDYSGDKIKIILKFLVVGLIAAVVAAPMLWDMFLLISQGFDAHASMDVTSVTAFNWRNVTRVFQLLFNPSSFLEVARLGGLYQSDFLMPYTGVIIFILALAGAISSNKYARFFGIFAAVFLFILAKLPPFVWLFYLPYLIKIIFLKYAGAFYFSLAVLAAIGFARLEKSELNIKKIAVIFTSIVFSLGAVYVFSESFREVYALKFTEQSLNQIYIQIEKLPDIAKTVVLYFIASPHFYSYIIFAMGLIWSLIFFIAVNKKRPALIFWLVVVELFIYMPKIRDGGFKPFNPFTEPPFISFLKKMPDIDQYRIFAFGKTLMPDVATVYGIRDLRVNDPVYLNRYINFAGSVLGEHPRERINSCWCVLFKEEEFAKNKDGFVKFFNQGSVKYILSEKGLLADGYYDLIYNGELKIYENKNALPIVYTSVKNGEILKNAVIKKLTSNVVEIEINSSAEGTLVFGENFYPGWRAFVDGKEFPVLVVNDIFRGVAVESETKSVIFRYNPFWALASEFPK